MTKTRPDILAGRCHAQQNIFAAPTPVNPLLTRTSEAAVRLGPLYPMHNMPRKVGGGDLLTQGQVWELSRSNAPHTALSLQHLNMEDSMLRSKVLTVAVGITFLSQNGASPLWVPI